MLFFLHVILPFLKRLPVVTLGRVAVLIVERPALVCISDRISSAALPHGVGKAATLIKTGHIFGSLVTYKPPPTTFPVWPIWCDAGEIFGGCLKPFFCDEHVDDQPSVNRQDILGFLRPFRV